MFSTSETAGIAERPAESVRRCAPISRSRASSVRRGFAAPARADWLQPSAGPNVESRQPLRAFLSGLAWLLCADMLLAKDNLAEVFLRVAVMRAILSDSCAWSRRAWIPPGRIYTVRREAHVPVRCWVLDQITLRSCTIRITRIPAVCRSAANCCNMKVCGSSLYGSLPCLFVKPTSNETKDSYVRCDRKWRQAVSRGAG
jgi:hypothetical protein